MRDSCSARRSRHGSHAKRAIQRVGVECRASLAGCSRTTSLRSRLGTRRPPYTLPFFARNRSMNPVSKFPARKSGSARIFRCSGIVVYMPSTINISSARAMREMASSRSLRAHDQLGDQRIVIRRNHSLGISRRIHAHASASWRMECRDLPRRRRELLRMLRIDAALDRMSAVHDRPVQNILHLRACRNHDLALHQVHIRHHLRHRMLHLDARIHLDEVQPPVLIHQELDGAGVPVSDLRQRLAQDAANLSRNSGVTCVEGDSSSSF